MRGSIESKYSKGYTEERNYNTMKCLRLEGIEG